MRAQLRMKTKIIQGLRGSTRPATGHGTQTHENLLTTSGTVLSRESTDLGMEGRTGLQTVDEETPTE